MVIHNKCSTSIWNPCDHKIQNLGSLHIDKGKISKSTPTKSISVRKPNLQISWSVITNNGKSSQKTLEFGWERLQTSEKKYNDNIDQNLNIDPKGTCFWNNVQALKSQSIGFAPQDFCRTVPQQCKTRRSCKTEFLRSLYVSKINGLHTQLHVLLWRAVLRKTFVSLSSFSEKS